MIRPGKICAQPGCPTITDGDSYCTNHAHHGRSPSSRISSRPWRRVRAAVLKRDNNTCHYCGAHADTVDHLLPVSQGADPYDASGCVAACSPCNASKGNRNAPTRSQTPPGGGTGGSIDLSAGRRAQVDSWPHGMEGVR